MTIGHGVAGGGQKGVFSIRHKVLYSQENGSPCETENGVGV